MWTSGFLPKLCSSHGEDQPREERLVRGGEQDRVEERIKGCGFVLPPPLDPPASPNAVSPTRETQANLGKAEGLCLQPLSFSEPVSPSMRCR